LGHGRSGACHDTRGRLDGAARYRPFAAEHAVHFSQEHRRAAAHPRGGSRIYRWKNPPAALPADLPDWQHRIAGLSHGALYLLLFIVPIAGYIRVKAGGFPIETLDWLGMPSLVPRSDAVAEVAKTVHYFAGLAIAAIVLSHIGAAAYHGIVRRDGVFSRMWPPFAGRGG
jgi:cytochrome b561